MSDAAVCVQENMFSGKMENRPVKIRPTSVVGNEIVSSNMSMIPYVMMAITGLSVGICIYLYRELSKVKISVNDIYKDMELIREKQDSQVDMVSIKKLDEKIERLGMFVQQLTKKIFEKEQSEEKLNVVETVQIPEEKSETVSVGSDSAEEMVCSTDHCEVPSPKKETKRKKGGRKINLDETV